ncbi:hypothetical protein NVP1215B_062 [Vibrio phage 1.215.B._10N.222.54.F7]|nr:hypothetical protein NVP1215A_062 [Vibrio phage 1.215.A._10N.222.54.F7]AUR96085.1 hypothetical protein NVP1215B_062 [Vibrio phage 1.215.B._10N.222.54.F7]
MKYVNEDILKAISTGKDKVTVTTEGGGEWELTPQHATNILDRVTSLPKGRIIDRELMKTNRIIFDTIQKEAAVKSNVKIGRKQAVERDPEE